MRSKAIKSLEAAKVLVDTRQVSGYNSSIHCSYYAVLQYMKYVLYKTDRNPITYEQQNAQKGSSHEYILKEIKNRINNRFQAKTFAELVRGLKNSRVAADYTQKDFTLEECLECKEIAENAIAKLKQHFGNL